MYVNFQNSPLYPQIRIVRRDNEVEFYTTLRKKHRNKWYLWDLYRKVVGKEYEAFYLDQLHHEVYFALTCGIIDPKLKDRHGMPIFRLDEHSQGDEKSRIGRLFDVATI